MFQKAYQKLQTKEGLMFVVSVAIIISVIGGIIGGFRHRGMGGFPGGAQQPSITVSGTGEVFAIPDTAQFSFTISKDAKTMAEAQKQVSDIGNDLIAKLKAAGIDEKDIKTEGFNAYPKYETKAMISACTPTYCPGAGNPVIVGYTVSHTYSVKVRNLNKSSDIAKLLTDAGVSSLNGPDFTIADIDSVKNDARDKAIADAKEQAKVLARQLGVRLGEIIDFQVVDNGYYPMPMYARASAVADAGMAEKVTAPDIQPGQSDIKVQVQITYRIR